MRRRRSNKKTDTQTMLILLAIIFFPFTILFFILKTLVDTRENSKVREVKIEDCEKSVDVNKLSSIQTHNHTYKLKNKTITNMERYYLNIIRKAFGEDYEIRFQVPLSSIIEKEKSFKNEYQSELNRIVDIGIFDKKTTTPLLLIEINDNTHYWKSRQSRDYKVKSICEDAGINLLTFWTDANNTEERIVNSINKELGR